MVDSDPSYSLSGFDYDGLDRLKNVNGKWGVGNFSYDTLSNIKTQSLGATNYTYSYSASNRLNSISLNNVVNKTFAYDGRGNTTQNGAQVLTFNAANELVSGNGAVYVYDAYHRLVKKTVAGVSTYSVYDHAGTLQTQYKAGSYTDFIKLGKQTVAEVKAGTATYQHSDVLGSPIAESTQGQSITRFHYKPFGERMENFATDDTGYTGHQFDTALGLTYMQQRYYDPMIGRFNSPDPVGYTTQNPVMSFNRYLYVNDNPYKYKDPDGKFLFLAFAVVSAGLTAYDTYQTYKTEGAGAAAKSLAIDGAISAIGGGVIKLGTKAFKAAKTLQKVEKAAERGTKGASGELTTVSGNKYQGNSTGSSATGGDPRAPMHPEVQQALDDVQNPSRTHGHCCEIDAMNKALNAGDDIQGAKMGPVTLNESGRTLPACSTCREVMKTLGVE